jgi:hypothetical protein
LGRTGTIDKTLLAVRWSRDGPETIVPLYKTSTLSIN